MLLKAMEERRKRHAREEWLALLPWMTEKTYKPFEQFYQERRRRNKPLSRRSKEEILAEVEAIREAAKRTA